MRVAREWYPNTREGVRRCVKSVPYHLWSDSLLGEILSAADFIVKLNQLLTASTATTVQSATETSDQPGPSPSSGLSPRTPTRAPGSVKKRSQLVSMQSPSKRCKHMTDSLDEDIERNKKGNRY